MNRLHLLQILLQYLSLAHLEGAFREVRHYWPWWWIMPLALSVSIGWFFGGKSHRSRRELLHDTLNGFVWFLAGIVVCDPLLELLAGVESASLFAGTWIWNISLLGGVHSIWVSPMQLRLHELIWLLMAIVGCCMFYKVSTKHLIIVSLIAVAGFLCSALALILLILDGDPVWEIQVGILSCLPVVVSILLAMVVLPDHGSERRELKMLSKRCVAWTLAGTLLLAIPCISWKGALRSGAVVIDEHHSEWSWLDAPFDQSNYGNMTTYNYVAFRQFVQMHWPTRVLASALTDNDLRDCSVFIIKMPTRSYSENEIQTVLDYVRRGGSLILIGDHTNVFGTSTNLNAIASHFGILYNFDAVHDAFQHERQVLTSAFGREHPAVVNTGATLMATSCSLSLAGSAIPVRVGRSVYADAGAYQNTSFFGNSQWDADERGVAVIQAAYSEYGEGKVLALADSTIYSTFTFYFPGIWDQLARALTFMVYNEGLFGERTAYLLRLLILAAGFGFALRNGLGLTLIWAAASLGVFQIANAINSHKYSIVGIRDATNDVLFYYDGDYVLPLEHESHAWDSNNYHTFFVWVQRMGHIPRVATSLKGALEGACAVFIHHSGRFTEGEKADVFRYLREGGCILLVLDPDSLTEEMIHFCAELGFGEVRALRQPMRIGRPAEQPSVVVQVRQAISFELGVPLFVNEEGIKVGAGQLFGGGKVAVIGVGREFSVDRLGTPKDVPTGAQRSLAQVEFDLFEWLYGVD